jgi:outer membrane protein TolC
MLVTLALLLKASAAGAQSRPTPAALPQGPFAGSVRVGESTDEPLSLSLMAAIERGLKSNLGVLLSRQSVRAAQGQRDQSVSALLPHLALSSSVNLQQLNVRAQEGLQFPGLPSVIGPFTYFDTRVRLTQSVFDLPSVLRARAGSEVVKAAEYSYQDARDEVVLAVGAAYLETAAQAARVSSAEAQRETARALHEQAVDRLKAGTTAAIDVLRAQVQFQTREQQLIAARNDLAKQKLVLARLIGLPLAQRFTVEDRRIHAPIIDDAGPAVASAEAEAERGEGVPAPASAKASARSRRSSPAFVASEGGSDGVRGSGGQSPPDINDVLRRAYAARADYRAIESQTRNLELQRKAASARSAPALSVNLDYGAVGVTPANASRTVGGFAAITIPIFQGGQIRGEVAQADAALAQSRAQLDDLRGRVEQDVRSALLDLESAAHQVRVATSTVDLATQTLEQARDRFVAGVTDNIEVVQAQETLANARETLIASEYTYGVAALQLARSIGNVEAALPDLLQER